MLKIDKLTIQENIPLAPLTTFKIGGPARFLVVAGSKDELIAALSWAKGKNLPVLIFGGGSNVLIPDEGWPGLVVRVAMGGWEFKELRIPNSELRINRIEVGAGVFMIPLALEASRRGLVGLEWAGGLPGTIGGAVRGNAGAFRFEISQTIKVATVLRQDKITKLENKDCGFVYRGSFFKNKFKDDIILSVEMELVAGDAVQSRKRLDDFLVHRRKSQPSLPNAGCIFKNFLITDKPRIFDGWSRIDRLPEEFLRYKKIPAGWLVEQVGMKGAQVGKAQVSPQHANFIVNLGGAKAVDVLALMKMIKEKVSNKFQITLEEEVRVVV